MSSTLRIEVSRANGANFTEEGKLASAANSRNSQNAFRHGVLAESIITHQESKDDFIQLLADLEEELKPVGHIENRLLEIMAVADWRRMRLWCLETAQYTHAIDMHHNSHVLELLNRYEVRFSREYRRAFTDLKRLRAERISKNCKTK